MSHVSAVDVEVKAKENGGREARIAGMHAKHRARTRRPAEAVLTEMVVLGASSYCDLAVLYYVFHTEISAHV